MLITRPLTDQIIDNTIDLDPEYQRGKCPPNFWRRDWI